MAAANPTAAAVRLVANDPEDTIDMDAASGYTPALGDLVAVSGNDEVDACDALDSNSLLEPFGVVVAIKAVRTTAGAAGKRVTIAQRGLLEGWTGLTAGDVLWNSATAGDYSDADLSDGTHTGYPIGVVINATQVLLAMPSLANLGV